MQQLILRLDRKSKNSLFAQQQKGMPQIFRRCVLVVTLEPLPFMILGFLQIGMRLTLL